MIGKLLCKIKISNKRFHIVITIVVTISTYLYCILRSMANAIKVKREDVLWRD